MPLLVIMSFISSRNVALNVSDDDRELVSQLLEDAEVIESLCRVGQPMPALVRTTFVPLLRKWIVEDGFFKAAKLILPYQPKFEVMTNPEDVKYCKAGVYNHWMAMIKFGPIGVGSALLSEKYIQQPPARTEHVTVFHPANVLFSQKVFYWKERFYTRKDIIWMHANRLGGVHLDFRRKPNESHINEIKNYFGLEVLPHTHQMLLGKDIETARADPSRREHVYDATELVAIDAALSLARGVLTSRQEFEKIRA